MTTPVARPQPFPRNCGGFTLIELMTVIISMSVLMTASVAVFKHSSQTSVRLETNINLKNYGQMAVNSMYSRLLQSRVLYQNDTYGNALWARVQFPATRAPISGSTLPTIKELGSLSPSQASDPENPFTAGSVGNSLFFLVFSRHVDAGGRWVDLYRPRAYYLSKTDSLKIGGRSYGLELSEWVGKEYADYSQLLAVPAATFTALAALGVNEAWDALSGSSVSTVYSISPGGVLTAVASPTLNSTQCQSVTHLNGSDRGARYAVAFNTTSSFKVDQTVPAYATASQSGMGFPNGFETLVVGPAGGRKTLLRLVLFGEGYGGRYSQDYEVLAQSKNY